MSDGQLPSDELDIASLLVREATACAKHLDEEGMGYSADVIRRAAAEITRLREFEWMYKDLQK